MSNEVAFVNPQFVREPYELPEMTRSEQDDSFPFKDLEDDYEKIHEQIRSLATKKLFHWTDVPVEFPKPLVDPENDLSRDLFLLPEFNELNQLAKGPNGGFKKLNQEQLNSIRKNGTFDVPSANFPGKFHRWQVHNFLQKGYERSTQGLYNSLSFALRLIIVTAKNRFASNRFSVLSGLKVWKKIFVNTINLLVGLTVKVTSWNQVEAAVNFHFQKYLLAELTVDDSNKRAYNELCNKIFVALKANKRIKHSDIEHISMPAFYRTKENLLIDLRLLDSTVLDKIKPIINEILKNDSVRMNQLKELRQTLVKQYREEGKPNYEIVVLTDAKLQEVYFNSLLDRLRASPELEEAYRGIGSTLCDHALALSIIRDEKKKLSEIVEAQCSAYRSELERKYPIRSGVVEWLNQCVEERRRKATFDCKVASFGRALERLKGLKLEQAAYFLERERDFMMKHENPSNGLIHYTVDKYQTYHNSTSYPFWRWTNFLLRTWCYSMNSMFIFGFIMPFVSRVSFTALFSIRPYTVQRKLDQITGEMVKDESSPKVLTFFSRLSAIWSHVAKARAHFEAQPDRGLIGKSVTRIFNVFWNYCVVGLVGTAALTAIFPPLCLTVSSASLVLGLTGLIWYPVLNLIIHLSFIVVYDWEYGDTGKWFAHLFPLLRQVVAFMLLVVVSPALALASGLVICPATSALVTAFALVKKAVRVLQDGFFYHALIKRRGRVPSADTWDIRRISGPGLAANHIYQMKPEQALALVELNVEKRILNSYFEYIKKRILEPIDLYDQVFRPIVEVYGYSSLDQKSKPFKVLYDETMKHLAKYECVYEQRNLRLNCASYTPNRARLSEENLKVVLNQATQIIKQNYEHIIFKYDDMTRERFFELQNMSVLNKDESDWVLYAGEFLESIFGAGVLKPIEESDDVFDLKVDHLNLGKYARMVAESELRDDLDVVLGRYVAEREHVTVDIPEKSYGAVFEPARVGYRCELITKREASFLPDNLLAVTVMTHNASASGDQQIEWDLKTQREFYAGLLDRFN